MNFLNSAHNFSQIRDEFRDTGMVVIKDYLNPEWAEAIYTCMQEQTPWDLTYDAADGRGQVRLNHRKVSKMPAKRLNKIRPRITSEKDYFDKFHYIHDVFWMRLAWKQGLKPVLYHKVAAALSSPQYVELMRGISGFPNVATVDCAASRYMPGHFLSAHNDGPVEDKLVAHVMGFTKGWQDDWGGQLTFCDEQGNNRIQRTPSFNTLVMFKIPRTHYVAKVSQEATLPRYSIYGWLRTSLK